MADSISPRKSIKGISIDGCPRVVLAIIPDAENEFTVITITIV